MAEEDKKAVDATTGEVSDVSNQSENGTNNTTTGNSTNATNDIPDESQGEGFAEANAKPVNMATWGPKTFSVSPDGVVAINPGFSTAIKLNTETNDDKSGKPATNTLTIEDQEISFDFNLNAYFLKSTTIGKEWDSWQKLIGKHYPLYFGGEQFGPKELQLIEAQLSDTTFDDWGRWLTAKISITLREWAPEKAKSKEVVDTQSGSSSKKGIASNDSKKKTTRK